MINFAPNNEHAGDHPPELIELAKRRPDQTFETWAWYYYSHPCIDDMARVFKSSRADLAERLHMLDD